MTWPAAHFVDAGSSTRQLIDGDRPDHFQPFHGLHSSGGSGEPACRAPGRLAAYRDGTAAGPNTAAVARARTKTPHPAWLNGVSWRSSLLRLTLYRLSLSQLPCSRAMANVQCNKCGEPGAETPVLRALCDQTDALLHLRTSNLHSCQVLSHQLFQASAFTPVASLNAACFPRKALPWRHA